MTAGYGDRNVRDATITQSVAYTVLCLGSPILGAHMPDVAVEAVLRVRLGFGRSLGHGFSCSSGASNKILLKVIELGLGGGGDLNVSVTVRENQTISPPPIEVQVGVVTPKQGVTPPSAFIKRRISSTSSRYLAT